MPRLVDLRCPACGHFIEDAFCGVNDQPRCPECETLMTQEWWPKARRERTQWDARDAVVVFKGPDGKISYPARNDKPTPAGMERVEMRSLAEVRRFEKANGVRNEMMDFDRGSGRGHDDGDGSRPPTPRRDTFSEVV